MNKIRQYRMNHFAKVIAFFLVFLILQGCSVYPNEYSFENKNEPIKSVELIYRPYTSDLSTSDDLLSIRFLEAEEIPQFMEKVYALQTERALPTPPSGWGVYIARVTYENGDVEYLGSLHIEYVKNGEKASSIGTYCFSGDSFDELFLEYAGDFSHLK